MADMEALERRVEQSRTLLQTSFAGMPHVAAAAAFDGITDLLLAAVEELRDIKELLEEARDARDA